MIRKCVYAILLLLMYSTYGVAQNIRFGIQSGIAYYRMEGLKDFNNKVFEELDFPAKMLSNYPEYIFYKPSLQFSLHALYFGIQTSFNSTGSRISSKDYSGEYLFDSRIKCIKPGIYIGYDILSWSDRFKVSVSMAAGVSLITLGMKERLTVIENEMINVSRDYSASSYFFEPGLNFNYHLTKSLGAELNFNWNFDFRKERFKTMSNLILDLNEQPVKADWDGLRLGLTLYVEL